jgi:aminopeptidase-like protein
MNNIGSEMYSLMERLFPICRSITGDGVRETLNILKEYIPIDIKEVPSGTKAFDWQIPDEWNIKDAYVKDRDGNRVIDFKRSNLHVVNYSIPFEGELTLDELKKHLYTLPDQPDLIPYVTSYYEKIWGFCLSQNQYDALKDTIYEVKIDATLKPGSLTYADIVIPGESEKEILLSTYVCHPSMANNELSGPVVATFIAKQILSQKQKPFFTYRIIFIPETIGSITYLSLHLEHLKKNVVAGYVVTCVGGPDLFSYLQTQVENTLVDRVTLHVLAHTEDDYKVYNFLERGSDERQYNAPGIDLPVGSLIKTKYHDYPEYHTSGDNLDFVTDEALKQTLDKYICCLDAIDNNHIYKTTVLCEPHLSKYKLYETLGRKGDNTNTLIWNLIAYCDGKNDLLDIANKIDCPIWELYPAVETIINQGLIVKSS